MDLNNILKKDNTKLVDVLKKQIWERERGAVCSALEGLVLSFKLSELTEPDKTWTANDIGKEIERVRASISSDTYETFHEKSSETYNLINSLLSSEKNTKPN